MPPPWSVNMLPVRDNSPFCLPTEKNLSLREFPWYYSAFSYLASELLPIPQGQACTLPFVILSQALFSFSCNTLCTHFPTGWRRGRVLALPLSSNVISVSLKNLKRFFLRPKKTYLL